MSKDIKVTGALVFPQNVPTRAGEVVNGVGEIYDIPAPRVGMIVYDKSSGINYIVRSLKAKVIDGVQVDDAQVDKYEKLDKEVFDAINTEVTRATKAENAIKLRAIDANSVNIEAGTEGVRIDFATLDNGDHSGDITIPTATMETSGVMSVEDKRNLHGKDTVTEQSVVFESTYQWIKLETPIKAGSVIELSGAGTKLNFYENRNSTANLIDVQGVAKVEYTYVRNLETVGDFHVKATLKSKIGELDAKIDMLEGKVNTVGDAVELQPFKDVTLYPAGDNLFFHYTKDDYKNLDVNTYILGEHYIAVDGGKDIFVSGNGYNIRAVMYDAGYKELGTKQITKNTVSTLPENCSFIKWSVAVSDLINKSPIMVNYGTEAKPYSIFTIDLTSALSNEIDDVKAEMLKIAIKADGEDVVTEYNVEFTGINQWIKLETPIKAGSVIELSGAGTKLNFYENRNSTANLIDVQGVAKVEYTYVRNLDTVGEFTIKVTEKSKIGLFEDKVEAIEDKVEAIEDTVTEYNFNFIGQYNWKELSTPIKAGSVIEVSGAGTTLYFYENKSSTAQKIVGSGVANADYTYANNYGTIGEFNIKVTEKGKIGVIQKEIETIKSDVETIKSDVNTLLQPKSEFILTEPTAVMLSSTSEHCLYLDDTIDGDVCGKKYGLTGTHFISYGSVAYVDKPVVGTKKGTFLAISATDKVRKEVYVKSVAPTPKAINMLDIGSSYIDIGTVTQRQYDNYVRDGYTVNILGTMGAAGKRHEARSGGTWDFLVKPLGRAVILDVNGVTDLPTTGYPGTTYQDANGIKWSVRGVMINDGVGKLVLSSFSVDTNYGGEAGSGDTDYDVAANNMPSVGTLTKTTNDSTGTSTSGGDDVIQYSGKELVYYNPFWNPTTNELDFIYYINKWGFATPDIITLTFGSNDLGNFAEASQETVDEVVDKAVSVADRIHEQLPDCKVLITCSCYGYKGVGENNFREVFRIKNIQKYYKTLIERLGQSTAYGDYVRVVPTMCMIDRENGYTISEKTLHSSYPAIKYARDIVHPNTNGFNQFADAMLGYAYDLL